MAIRVECPKCSHAWSVPTAKAGRSVYCPECDESVEVLRPKTERPEAEKVERLPLGHRPKTDNRSKDRTLLIGAAVLLLGVLLVVGLRIKAVMSDPNLEFDPTPVTDLTKPGAEAVPEDGETSGDVPPAPGDSAAKDGDSGQGAGEAPVTTASGDFSRRKQLAELSEIAIDVDNFAADVRGAISNVVETNVAGAMRKCRLTPNDSVEPVMQVTLELRPNGNEDDLWMTAQLIASQNADMEVLWQRTSALGPITPQAFRSGIVPPGLDREVASFFNDLRAEFVTVRREFQRP